MPQQAVPFFVSTDLNMEQGGKALAVSFAFTAAVPQIVNTNSLADVGLFSLQGAYIDNSLSPGPTSILITGTRQVITVAPYTQGYYRLLASPAMLDYVITNESGGSLDGGVPTPVTVIFLNVMPPDAGVVWSSGAPQEEEETPIAASATGANAILTATFPAVAGRTTYVSGIVLSGAGSTAGGAVNATLTNIDNDGVAQTLNFAFVFPTGALVSASPIQVNFSPPLKVLNGAAAVLTLPAGGAGNTDASIVMTGQLV